MIEVVRDEGTGRPIVILCEDGNLDSEHIVRTIKGNQRVIQLKTERITPNNWRGLSEEVSAVFEGMKLRQVSFLSFADASIVALHRSLDEGKFVRSLVLYEPICSPHPTLVERGVDWIEKHLPLGLPLRTLQEGFNAESFLHRVRCPTAVVVRDSADIFRKTQAGVIVKGVSTAWLVTIPREESCEGVISAVLDDMAEIPAKCPQKRRATPMENVA